MKKIYKIILISLGVFILLLITGTNLILKGVVISSLEETLSRKVSIDSLWLNPFTGTLSSRGVIIWNDKKEQLLSVKSIEVNTAPLKLFTKKLSISEIRLMEPTLNLIYLGSDSKVKKGDPSPTKKEEKNLKTSSKNFIKEVEIKNIAVERLTFIRPKGILKSMNTITFKVPDFSYENNELYLSASLNILGSGLVDLTLKANTEKGTADTSFTTQGFEFVNTFSPNEGDEIKLSGNIKGNIFIRGNYLKKEFQAEGNIKGDISIKRPSLTYSDLAFTNLNLKLQNLRNIPGNKASIFASFTLNNSIDFSTESLVEILDYSTRFDPLKSLILEGNFVLDTPSWVLPNSIKKKLPYETKIQKVNLKGDYSFDYPKIILKSDIFTEDLKLIGKEKQFHNILLKSLYGDCSLSYNLENNYYSLSGPLNFKGFNIKNKKDKDFFMGDISAKLSALNKDIITLSSVTLSNFFLDLNTLISPKKSKFSPKESITSEKNNSSSKEKGVEIKIDNLKLRKGRVFTKNLSFEKIYLDGNNISNKKINSHFVIDTLIDSSTPLRGDLKIQIDDMNTFSDLQAKGNISISNLDLKTLTSYMENLPYKISGKVDYSSFLDYSKGSISSKGNCLGSDLHIKKNDSIEISVEDLQSKLNFNFKKEELTLSNSSFSLSNLKGKIQDKTKVQLAKGDIVIEKYSPKTIQFKSISLTSPVIDLKESTKEENTSSKGSSDPKKKDLQPLPTISTSKINIKNGKIIYRGLKKTSIYKNIGFSAINFTTQKNKHFPIDTDLSLAGIEKVGVKGNLSLKQDWDFSPKTFTFSGTLNVTRLNIPTFNNLLQKSLPNKFNGGILSSKGRVKLNTGQLNSEHDITISKVDLGKTTGYSKTIPLGSIIKVLSDKYGNIRITLPITGDLTNPKLGVTTIITSSLMSGLIKAARSPQTIISKILTLGNDEIKTIYFRYLLGKPSELEIDKLSEITNILTENPKLKVTFTLYTNEDIEMSLLTTKSITGILLGQKIDPQKTLKNLMEERKKYILDFFSDRVSSERIGIKVSKENKTLPQAKVEFKE